MYIIELVREYYLRANINLIDYLCNNKQIEDIFDKPYLYTSLNSKTSTVLDMFSKPITSIELVEKEHVTLYGRDELFLERQTSENILVIFGDFYDDILIDAYTSISSIPVMVEKINTYERNSVIILVSITDIQDLTQKTIK